MNRARGGGRWSKWAEEGKEGNQTAPSLKLLGLSTEGCSYQRQQRSGRCMNGAGNRTVLTVAMRLAAQTNLINLKPKFKCNDHDHLPAYPRPGPGPHPDMPHKGIQIRVQHTHPSLALSLPSRATHPPALTLAFALHRRSPGV